MKRSVAITIVASLWVTAIITKDKSFDLILTILMILTAFVFFFWPERKPKYRRIELRFVTWAEGDRLIKESKGKPEAEQWQLAIPEEDNNRSLGYVYLERKELIK